MDGKTKSSEQEKSSSSEADLQMAGMFDAMPLAQKLEMLKLFQDKDSQAKQNAHKESLAAGASGSMAAPVGYVRVEVPSLPRFAGEGKGHASYSLWRFELKCLIDNPEVSRTSIWQAVRKSLTGLASELMICLGGSPTLEALLQKFDSHFANSKTLEQLLQEFYIAQQQQDQSCTAWGCHLEELMVNIQEKGTFSTETAKIMLRSKFFTGLRSEKLKAALRHRLDTDDTFEDLLKKARMLDSEIEQPQVSKKVQSQQHVTSSLEGKIDEMLHQLRTLDGRVQKIENQNASAKPAKPDTDARKTKYSVRKMKFYGTKGICWQCGDKRHKLGTCPHLND